MKRRLCPVCGTRLGISILGSKNRPPGPAACLASATIAAGQDRRFSNPRAMCNRSAQVLGDVLGDVFAEQHRVIVGEHVAAG